MCTQKIQWNIKDSPLTWGEKEGASLSAIRWSLKCTCATKEWRQRRFGDKCFFGMPKKLCKSRKMRENTEDFACFICHICLYNSIFDLVESHCEKCLKLIIFDNFSQKIDFESPQTPLKQGIQSQKRFCHFGVRRCLYNSICGRKNVENRKKNTPKRRGFSLICHPQTLIY